MTTVLTSDWLGVLENSEWINLRYKINVKRGQHHELYLRLVDS